MNLNFELNNPLYVIPDDFNSFMLISNQSLNELNSRLTADGKNVTMKNFRPNLIVDSSKPYAEVTQNLKMLIYYLY